MYYYKAQSLLLTLITGLFLLNQALGFPAPVSESSAAEDVNSFHLGGLTCTKISSSSPLTKDCREALKKIAPSNPDSPGVCITRVFRGEANPATVGTCHIQLYSERGRAHCLDGTYVRKGVQAILSGCSSSYRYSEYTQGNYTWTAPGEWKEGVRLISTEGV